MGTAGWHVSAFDIHPQKTPVGVLPWTGRSERKWPSNLTVTSSGLRLGRSEVLRSLRHYLLARRRMRIGHSQSDQHWNCFKGNAGEISERRSGADMGFSERKDTTLNWTVLNAYNRYYVSFLCGNHCFSVSCEVFKPSVVLFCCCLFYFYFYLPTV